MCARFNVEAQHLDYLKMLHLLIELRSYRFFKALFNFNQGIFLIIK